MAPASPFWQLNHAYSACFGSISANFPKFRYSAPSFCKSWVRSWTVRWAKFDFEMSATYIHKCQCKIQIHLEKRGLWMPVHQHSEEKSSKISDNTFAILPFSHQNSLTRLPSRVLWGLPRPLLIWTHHMRFKIVHSNTKNAKSRVRQFQVCHLHTTHSSVLNALYI